MLLNGRYLRPKETKATCQNCQDLNLRQPDIPGTLGIPIALLKKSSESGCPSCRLLLKALELPGLEPPNGEPLFGITLLCDKAFENDYSEGTSRPLIIRLETMYMQFAEVELFTEVGFPCCWPVIGHARGIDMDASSKRCIDLIKSWITDCLAKHTVCKSATQSCILPDRVLDVRVGRDPFLYITGGTQNGQYAALSHCWGGDVALKLTDHNFDMLQKGINLEALPKTFRHAVEICRLLGIDFLWIDSLCIIQSSRQDWDVQGSKMDAVYANSFLVIGADGASNSEEGFLCDPKRQPSSLQLPCSIVDPTISANSASDGNSKTYIYARGKGFSALDIFEHHTWTADTKSKLSTRGWVLQESVLAPRILHFTTEEVTWECKEVSRCECQVAPHTFKYELPLKHGLQTPLGRNTDWLGLVEELSCRDLTSPFDRLPAMAGFAALMQRADSNVTYYAGLWSDSLPESLFWLCIPYGLDSVTKTSKRVYPPCAPTWSWASITGRVSFPKAGDNTHSYNLRDINISCPRSSQNKYDVIPGSTLRASAFVLRGIIKHFLEMDKVVEYEIQPIQDRIDGSSVSRLHGGIFLDVIGDDSEICEEDEVMLVSETVEHDMWSGTGTFLVLKEVREAKDTYTRIGVTILKMEGFLDQSYGQRQIVTII